MEIIYAHTSVNNYNPSGMIHAAGLRPSIYLAAERLLSCSKILQKIEFDLAS